MLTATIPTKREAVNNSQSGSTFYMLPGGLPGSSLWALYLFLCWLHKEPAEGVELCSNGVV